MESGKKIIITIVHKFPYILEAIGGELMHKRFGIIIDEAHSSQNGSLSAKMNIALSGNAGDDDMDLEDRLTAIIEGRKMVKNANYYLDLFLDFNTFIPFPPLPPSPLPHTADVNISEKV